MQIDFHHGVTYTVARLAGFEHRQASTIAYCAQYVDDAVNAGMVRFDNGALFERISSAHKMLDYRNFRELANHYVWIPFHFLPGNGGLPAGTESDSRFVDKLICRPNSDVAQQMVRECILRQDAPYGLHRLGITMHVYADTWAHQGFAGIRDRVNEATRLVDEWGVPDCKFRERMTGYFMSEAMPLGHGAVLSQPDKPYLRWGYTNGRGEKIWRDNPKDFLEAADHMCQAMQRYRLKNPDAIVPGLPPLDRQLIATLFETLTYPDRKLRHRLWLAAIAEGKFSFGRAVVDYIPKGKLSWKFLALGTERERDRGDEVFPYREQFLASDWKYFHDALQAHRLFVLHDLLPRYGICAA